ncbi:hypothetical protein Pmani_036239 [Petrolisthes manimaculis]|uniref:Uncharacterized protein n=1 Tax=Petrolisthes manimaculis TaxID=1843537 RepID=A0AAE1NK12_9EUCA|nr:hypothetical protein Pmani_036239 [Petrolisthes manimaculis]
MSGSAEILWCNAPLRAKHSESKAKQRRGGADSCWVEREGEVATNRTVEGEVANNRTTKGEVANNRTVDGEVANNRTVDGEEANSRRSEVRRSKGCWYEWDQVCIRAIKV